MMESLCHYEHLLSCVNIIKKSSPILKRYLSFILNNDVSVLTPDLNVLEEQANDINYIQLLNQRPSEAVIKWLLSYLPLFNKNIGELKPAYLNLLKRIQNDTFHSITSGSSTINYLEYYYLLIIASIHPAFNRDEQNIFEDSAKILQKAVLSLSNNMSHHDYNFTSDDTDEGIGSSSQQLASLSKQNSGNCGSSNYLNVDTATPLKQTIGSKLPARVANCLSAPPSIETYDKKCFGSKTFISSENEEEGDTYDDDDDEDTDLNNNSQNNNYNRIETPMKHDSSHSSLADDSNGNAFNFTHTDNSSKFNFSLNTITPIISINDTKVNRPLMHRPLSRTNGSEPSQYQKARTTTADILSCRSYGSSFELDQPRNGSNEINTFTDYDSGMKDAPVWLKRLRLHKYTHIFSKMTYDEMMELNEQKLLDLKVTAGATRKILLEIEKLRDRAKTLNQLAEKTNYTDANEIESVLFDLCEMAWTPMKPYRMNNSVNDEGVALTAAFIKLLDMVQEALIQLYQSKNSASNFLFSILIQLIDKLVTNPSFSNEQKNQMKTWRSQLCNLNKNLKLNFIPIPKKNPKKNQNKKFLKGPAHTPLKPSASNPHESARSHLETPVNYTSNMFQSASVGYQKQPIFKTYSEKPASSSSSNFDSIRTYSHFSPTNHN